MSASQLLFYVTEVYFFDNYITVTQDGSVDWDKIEEPIKKIISQKAADHDPDFQVEEVNKPIIPSSSDPEITKINAILDSTIRPGLQMDGGDLQIVSLDGITFRHALPLAQSDL